MPEEFAKITVDPVKIGRSAATRDRKDGVPDDPFGAAKIEFADSDARVIARVPAEVIGDPETEKMLGAERPTDETVAENVSEKIYPEESQTKNFPPLIVPFIT